MMNKLSKGKLDNEILQDSHNKLRPNSLIKIINNKIKIYINKNLKNKLSRFL